MIFCFLDFFFSDDIFLKVVVSFQCICVLNNSQHPERSVQTDKDKC